MKKFLATFLMFFGVVGNQAKAEETDMDGHKILVAYFSATGTTAQVAQRLATATGGDLFEIKPEVLYTDADLDWRNKQSRSSVEMADRSSRPAISSKVENMGEYDIVFIGFPIWWYREPSIIDTFLESYDFAGKTIVPFATSGGSSMGDSSEIMQALVPGAKVEKGKRFAADVSEETLKTWSAEWVK